MASPAPVVRDYPESAVVIAGGTSGVGLASALRFVDAGVRRLALIARDQERGEAARQAVTERCPSAQVVFVAADASEPAQALAGIAEAHRALGAIDVLVNSVTSAYRPELLYRTAMTDIAAILLAQALPPMHLTRAALPIMTGQGGGSIVNIASDAAKVATPGRACSAPPWPGS